MLHIWYIYLRLPQESTKGGGGNKKINDSVFSLDKKVFTLKMVAMAVLVHDPGLHTN